MDPIVLWRRPKTTHAPLVLLLHGRGADEHDLIDLADVLPRRFAYASPRAPVPVEGGGFTWFENRGPATPIAASLRTSATDLRAWIDATGFERCVLLGFSAGMMMAGALLLDDPQRYAGAVLLSGALALDAASDAGPGRLAGRPVFLGRGTLDDVIPADLVRRTDTYLRERSGADLTAGAYPIGHAIAGRELSDIAAWLDERG